MGRMMGKGFNMKNDYLKIDMLYITFTLDILLGLCFANHGNNILNMGHFFINLILS